MCILPKWRRKEYGKYLMDKLFTSDPKLQNMKVYVVERLIHDDTHPDYEKLGSKHTEEELGVQISQNIIDERKNDSPGIPKCDK